MKELAKIIIQRFDQCAEVMKKNSSNANLNCYILQASTAIVEAIKNGKKVVMFGNGGSASDALHFAGEIVGRFQKERKAWPAIALNSDVASITAISNDYGYEEVFARQVEGIVSSGDVVIGISTSGNSENVYRGVLMGKEKGAKTIALLGKNGGKIKNVVDYPLVVENDTVSKIQESHICIIHIMCELIEDLLEKK